MSGASVSSTPLEVGCVPCVSSHRDYLLKVACGHWFRRHQHGATGSRTVKAAPFTHCTVDFNLPPRNSVTVRTIYSPCPKPRGSSRRPVGVVSLTPEETIKYLGSIVWSNANTAVNDINRTRSG